MVHVLAVGGDAHINLRNVRVCRKGIAPNHSPLFAPWNNHSFVRWCWRNYEFVNEKNSRSDATKPLTCYSSQNQQYRHVSLKVPPKGSDHRSQTDRTMKNQRLVTTAAKGSTADRSSMASCHARTVRARCQVQIHLLGMSSNAAVPAHGSPAQRVPPTVP